MAQVNLKARSGNNIVITFDGKQVGAIKSVSLNDDYSPEPVTGIGDIHVAEWVPTVARHTLSINSLVLRIGSMREAGITALNGEDVLIGRVFDILVISKEDGKLLRKYTGCSYASGSVEVSANAIVVNSGQFNALNVTGDGV
jgi:hypothetical protein